MPASLRDSFGREVTYLRLSVTDRCDLRCSYCMAEKMTFLPKKDVLSLEELYQISLAFIDRGVRKIRISGGEPLVRRDIMSLMQRLSRQLEAGRLDELTLTTNATQLARFAPALKACGVERVNISLDTLNPEKFTELTRRAMLTSVLNGIDAGLAAGLKLKINVVALKGFNEDEIPQMIRWSHERNMALTLIEVMPLGEVEVDRVDQYLPLSAVRERLAQEWTLENMDLTTGGPARYVKVRETGGVLGFITPLTNNFCAGCNRVRVTCTGQIYMCLGQSDCIDLRGALRGETPSAALDAALDRAMLRKPERHSFDISKRNAAPALTRHMSVTGG